MVESWEEMLPAVPSSLPLGGVLHRTDPSGARTAKIAFLGVYPAATKLDRWRHNGQTYQLPVGVERTSFDPESRSGTEVDARYLAPLRLSRDDVLLFDMMPYFLANTSNSGNEARSMWSNVQLYERVTCTKTAVRPRPEPDELLVECERIPGNHERLKSIFRSATNLRLLFTLGNEAAAFVRCISHAKDAQKHLYEPPEGGVRAVLGRTGVCVVHLAHPGLLIKNTRWRQKHATWCEKTGQELVRKVLGTC